MHIRASASERRNKHETSNGVHCAPRLASLGRGGIGRAWKPSLSGEGGGSCGARGSNSGFDLNCSRSGDIGRVGPFLQYGSASSSLSLCLRKCHSGEFAWIRAFDKRTRASANEVTDAVHTHQRALSSERVRDTRGWPNSAGDDVGVTTRSTLRTFPVLLHFRWRGLRRFSTARLRPTVCFSFLSLAD
jgi:hypothetical protein